MATLRENPAKSETFSRLHVKSHDQLKGEVFWIKVRHMLGLVEKNTITFHISRWLFQSPVEKHESKWVHLPQGVNIKHIWNHFVWSRTCEVCTSVLPWSIFETTTQVLGVTSCDGCEKNSPNLKRYKNHLETVRYFFLSTKNGKNWWFVWGLLWFWDSRFSL